MAKASWTLEIGGTEKTLGAWGFIQGGSVLTRRSLAADTLQLVARQPGILAAYGVATLKKDGVVYFSGTVLPRQAANQSGPADRCRYTIAGPWWDLENTIYQQYYGSTSSSSGDPPTPETEPKLKSRVMLGEGLDGSPQASAYEVEEIVKYAAAKGARIAWGAGWSGGLNPPPTEMLDSTCAECLAALLRWNPDVISYVDYTAAPAPKIYFKRQSELTGATIAKAAATRINLEDISDLRPPAVVIHYEYAHEVDGRPYPEIRDDIYPEGYSLSMVGVPVFTMPMDGVQKTFLKQYVETETLPPLPEPTVEEVRDWLALRYPWIKDIPTGMLEVAKYDLEIPEGGVLEQSGDDAPEPEDLPREIVEGHLTDWMGVAAARAKATVILTYTGPRSAGARAAFGDDFTRTWEIPVLATDALTKTYTKLAGFDGEEPTPTGLAQAYWNAARAQTYRGAVEIKEENCGDTKARWLGFKLNVTGGETGWASMGVAITGQTEQICEGITSVEIGPPLWLNPADFVERGRANRRQPAKYRSAGVRTGEEVDKKNDFTEVPGAKAGPREIAPVAEPALEVPWTPRPIYEAAAWKVILLPGKALGFDGTNYYAEIDTTVATAAPDSLPRLTPAAGHYVYAECSLSEPAANADGSTPGFYKVTAVDVKTGATVPADDLEGGKGYVRMWKFASAGGDESTPPEMTPIMAGALYCIFPTAHPKADDESGDSGSGDSGSGEPEVPLIKVANDQSRLVVENLESGCKITLEWRFYEIRVPYEDTDLRNDVWTCECCGDGGSGIETV